MWHPLSEIASGKDVPELTYEADDWSSKRQPVVQHGTELAHSRLPKRLALATPAIAMALGGSSNASHSLDVGRLHSWVIRCVRLCDDASVSSRPACNND